MNYYIALIIRSWPKRMFHNNFFDAVYKIRFSFNLNCSGCHCDVAPYCYPSLRWISVAVNNVIAFGRTHNQAYIDGPTVSKGSLLADEYLFYVRCDLKTT